MRLEHVEAVVDLLQGGIRIVHRHAGEETETTAGVGGELRRVLVGFSRDAARELARRRHAGCRDGEHRACHPRGVHVLDLLLQIPRVHRAGQIQPTDRRRLIVRVDVDDVPARARIGRSSIPDRRQQRRRPQRSEHAPTCPSICPRRIAVSRQSQRSTGGLRQPEPAANEADGGENEWIEKTRIDVARGRDQREGRHGQQSADPSRTDVVRHRERGVADRRREELDQRRGLRPVERRRCEHEQQQDPEQRGQVHRCGSASGRIPGGCQRALSVPPMRALSPVRARRPIVQRPFHHPPAAHADARPPVHAATHQRIGHTAVGERGPDDVAGRARRLAPQQIELQTTGGGIGRDDHGRCSRRLLERGIRRRGHRVEPGK